MKRLWTEDRIARLCQLLSDGHNTSSAAVRLGVSASAITNKIHNMRLEGDKRLPREWADRTRRHTAPVVHMGKLPPRVDRDPCPRCGVRGDIGCRHRVAPWGAAA